MLIFTFGHRFVRRSLCLCFVVSSCFRFSLLLRRLRLCSFSGSLVFLVVFVVVWSVFFLVLYSSEAASMQTGRPSTAAADVLSTNKTNVCVCVRARARARVHVRVRVRVCVCV